LQFDLICDYWRTCRW